MWTEICRELISTCRNICLCDGNPFIVICKHHKQDATLQDLKMH
jgi:hypothetical protein